MNFDHPLNCLTFNLQRASRSLVRGFEKAVKEAGLTAPQFTTLMLLGGFGEMTVGQIAERLGTERTTMTRNLDLLAGKGWIAVSAAEDQRLRPYALTDAGRERLNAAMPAWNDYQGKLLAKLGKAEATALVETVRKL